MARREGGTDKEVLSAEQEFKTQHSALLPSLALQSDMATSRGEVGIMPKISSLVHMALPKRVLAKNAVTV
jgi:hypothetical protein